MTLILGLIPGKSNDTFNHLCLPFGTYSFAHQAHTGVMDLPLFVNDCVQLGFSVFVSLAKQTGAGKIALMGLAAANRDDFGLPLLFCSCPLGAIPRASPLKEMKHNRELA